jgi:hypothetical protein
MPIHTFQAVPVDKMKDYKTYETYYKEHHPSTNGSVDPTEQLNVVYNNEDNTGTSGSRDLLTSEFKEIEDLFKSRYQGMARVILSIVRKAGGRMDQYQRLIYPNGQLGSSLFELVRYAVIPTKSRKAQPIDFPQFGRLLRDQNAPSYILAKLGTSSTSSTTQLSGEKLWLRLPVQL